EKQAQSCRRPTFGTCHQRVSTFTFLPTMNLPNKLTISRFFLTAAFLWAMFSRSPVNDTLALVFFSLAGISDFLDGKIARSRNLITNFGALMDPLADKIMTCSAFIALVERHMRAMVMGDLPVVF